MSNETWLREATRLAHIRGPGMTPEHAREVAEDLYAAWPENTPAEAVAWFFAFMPPGWNAEVQEAAMFAA